MGIRHAQGICGMPELSQLCIVDKFEGALTNAKDALKISEGFSNTSFMLLDDFNVTDQKFDIAILAATSQKRLENCQLLIDKGVKHILVEKPLGQSTAEVKELISTEETPVQEEVTEAPVEAPSTGSKKRASK